MLSYDLSCSSLVSPTTTYKTESILPWLAPHQLSSDAASSPLNPVAGISTSSIKLQTQVKSLSLDAQWIRTELALPYSTVHGQQQSGGKEGVLTSIGRILKVEGMTL